MGTAGNFYEVLQLQRNSDAVDVKKAYRRLALKYHPDRDSSEEAKRAFALIAEAYEVLSDPERKGLYDSYGEEGLGMTVKDGQGGTIGGLSPINVDPVAVFDKFFGTSNPYAAMIDSAAAFASEGAGPKAEVGVATVYMLDLTLEEVFTGARKIVQHKKRVARPDGSFEVVEKPLVVDVPPSVPDGQRFVFDPKPPSEPTTGPAAAAAASDALPVVVVAQQLPHASFQRLGEGFDLRHTARVPLVKALCGTVLSLKALDGRQLSIPVPEIIPCGATKTLEGLGLPRGDGTRGDLVVHFEVVFPRGVSDTQKTLLRAALFLPQQLNKEQAAAVKAFTRAFQEPKLGWAHAYPQ